MSDYNSSLSDGADFSLDDESIRDAYEILAARRGSGMPLGVDLGGLMEKCFQTDFSGVRIHTDAAAKSLTALLGADALACGNDLFFAPGKFAPQTKDGFHLLAHELAHSIQQRGGIVRESLRKNLPSNALEREADDAATAVLKGQRPVVSARGECPEMLPAAPAVLAILAAIATGGAGLYSAFGRDEDMKKDAAQPSGYHNHEGYYALIPFYGSIDQILNGRTAFSRMFGTFMLILDVSTVGAMAKGVAVGFRGAGSILAAKEALAVAGTEAVKEAGKEAGEKFVGQGVKLATQEQAAEHIASVLEGKTAMVMAVNEGLNHSAIYLINQTKVFKIQGGFYKYFVTSEVERSAGVVESIARKSNIISLYEVEAKTLQEAIDTAEARNLMIGGLKQFWKTSACAGTQLLMLENLGLGIKGASGFSKMRPLFPFLLDGARATAGHNSTHYILNKFSPSMTSFFLGLSYLEVPHAAGETFLGFPLRNFFRATPENPMYGMRAEEIPLGTLGYELANNFPRISSPGRLNLVLSPEAAAAIAPPLPKPPTPAKPNVLIEVEPNLSIQEKQVLDQLELQNAKSPDRIARLTGLTLYEVSRALEHLMSKMLIRRASFNSDNTGYVKNQSFGFNRKF